MEADESQEEPAAYRPGILFIVVFFVPILIFFYLSEVSDVGDVAVSFAIAFVFSGLTLLSALADYIWRPRLEVWLFMGAIVVALIKSLALSPSILLSAFAAIIASLTLAIGASFCIGYCIAQFIAKEKEDAQIVYIMS